MVTSKSKQTIANLKANRRLYTNLLVACQARDGNLDNFFAFENHAYPVFVRIWDIEEVFCKEHGIPWKVHQQLGDLKRLDFVFYTYKTDSIKGQTRERRGIGVRLTARMETSIVKKFQVFLKNSDNKTELFKMLAINITKIPASIVEIMATHLEEVLSKNLDADLSALQPCNHEEADTRLLLQALNASKSGFKRLLIVTVDTDVVVLALCHFFNLDLQDLWIEIGTGKNRRWFPIHLHVETLQQEMCQTLHFWFALTGCDSVSMFAGWGKGTA